MERKINPRFEPLLVEMVVRCALRSLGHRRYHVRLKRHPTTHPEGCITIEVRTSWVDAWKKWFAFYFRREVQTRVRHWLYKEVSENWAGTDVEVTFR